MTAINGGFHHPDAILDLKIITHCLVDQMRLGLMYKKPEAYYASGLKDYVCYAFSFSKILSFTAIIG